MKHLALLSSGLVLIAVGCGKGDSGATAETPSTPATKVAGSGTSPTPATAGAAGSFAAAQAVFNQNCVGCHGAGRPKAGIDLTSYESIMKGGKEGPIVKPGDPGASPVAEALHGVNHVRQMPPKGPPLPADQIKLVEDWIKAGAKQA